MKKRFGQNFLHDKNIINKILAAVAAKNIDHIVEIGGGSGALTRELVGKPNRYDIIEIDRDLAPLLEKICANQNQCFIHNIDVLNFDFASIYHDDKLRIVGNLPYNISTPLLFYLIEYKHLVKDMHFMLQLEVAERLAAKPGTKDYGRLSVMVQYDFNIELLFKVSPECFTPKPKVESAFIRMLPIENRNHIAKKPEMFANVVRAAFSTRRKTLRNALKNFLTIEQINTLEKSGFNLSARAEELSVDEFVDLSNAVN